MPDGDFAIVPQMVDRQSFRSTMSRFATGVAVLTAFHEGQPFGMTVNSLTSVSLDPCKILVCVKCGSSTGEAIKASGLFAVNLLDRTQRDVAQSFVGPDAARFGSVAFAGAEFGLPLIEGALASISCELAETVRSGDHDILIGNVFDCSQRNGDPLVFFGGSYGGFGQ